jgi:hypothetical protein
MSKFTEHNWIKIKEESISYISYYCKDCGSFLDISKKDKLSKWFATFEKEERPPYHHWYNVYKTQIISCKALQHKYNLFLLKEILL